MFDHEFLQHVMIPFSITKCRLEYANHLSKNKALRNILLIWFAVRLEFTAAKRLSTGQSAVQVIYI